MDARDFLVLARQLIGSSDEAAWRSGVSRGYYAAFHVCREFMEWLRFKPPQSDRAHAYLWMRFHNSQDALLIQAGGELSNLRGRRNIADYDLRRSMSQAAARIEVQAAEAIITLIETIQRDPARSAAARDAMVLYERDVLQDVTWTP